MARQNPDVIGISNDWERNIRDYFVFDLNSMSTGIIRPEITAAHFKFKPMMFQMLQIVGKFSSVVTCYKRSSVSP